MLKRSGIRALKKLKKKTGQPKQTLFARHHRQSKNKIETTDPNVSVPKAASKQEKAQGVVHAAKKTKAAQQSRTSRRFHAGKKAMANLFGRMTAAFGISRTSDNDENDPAAGRRYSSKAHSRRKRVVVFGAACGIVAAAVLLAIILPQKSSVPADAAQEQTHMAALDLTTAKTGGQTAALGAKLPYVMPFSAVFAEEPVAVYQETMLLTEPDSPDTMQPSSSATPEPSPTATASPEPTPTKTPKPTPEPFKADDFLDYFVVKADTYYNEVGYSSNVYAYTHEDYLMLARIIHGEARGQSYNGQVAVGNVIMNRVFCRAFPNNIIDVITAPRQFTVYERVKDLSESEINATSKRAARAVLERELWVVPQNAYFFKAGSEGVDWGSRKFGVKIGGHCFYTYDYSGRYKGSGIPPALFERTFKHAQYGCKPERRVHRIQYMLNKLGYNVKADSYFGQTTKDALIEFQKKNKLKADGIAGPATLRKLIKEYGVQNYYDRFIKK